MGDIAMPITHYDLELELSKAKESEMDEVEKFKKEILVDGLQIEEEGLENIRKTSYAKKVLKIPAKSLKNSTQSDVETTTLPEVTTEAEVIPQAREHTFEEYQKNANAGEEMTTDYVKEKPTPTKVLTSTKVLSPTKVPTNFRKKTSRETSNYEIFDSPY